jgi:hypothetical protein
MSDEQMQQAFEALSPTPAQVESIRARVIDRYQAAPRSLWREWLELFIARPVANGALIAAAACVLWLTTPLGALFSALRAAGAEPPARAAACPPGLHPDRQTAYEAPSWPSEWSIAARAKATSCSTSSASHVAAKRARGSAARAKARRTPRSSSE